MARILAVSSQVVSGHVGLSAIVPALQRLGHEVLPLPTILLSNHPGQQRASGTRIAPEVLSGMLATLGQNGRLDGIDAVLTGYLPSAPHVAIAINAIAQCRSKDQQPLVLCDPVIGDDPKGIYIEIEAAAAIRDQLVQMADIVTPNRFELAWLTGSPVACTATATAAAAKLRRPIIIATSIPFESNRLANVAVTPTNSDYVAVTRRTSAPNGTGDLLSALFLAAYLENDRKVVPALARATAAIEAVLSASNGHHELRLIQSQNDWLRQLARSAN